MSDITVPSPERIQADIRHLKEWLSKQPHLPKIDDEDWLETFLHSSKFSLEKTKSKLDNYYSLRSKYPEILKNRDPTSPDLLRSSEVMETGFADRLTEDNIRIVFVKYGKDADAFQAEHFMKRIFMIFDTYLLNEENRSAHLAFVTDFQDASYLHVLKLMTCIAKTAEIFNGAYSERVSGVHIINLPSFAERAVELIKGYCPKKIADRFYVHTQTKSTLLEMLDANVVCSDFGGAGTSLEELHDLTQKHLEKHRKWFEEQEGLCSNELLRQRDNEQMEEMQGSFRKLDMD